jgi:glycosyltransferase involved in cell wall biosynthesis
MQKLRVLHIANRMNPGGVERWLLGVAEGLKGSNTNIDVLVHSELPGGLDEQFKSTGSQIIKCQYNKNPLSYAIRLFKTLRQYGPYDVVHSHVHHFSGFVLCVAFFAGVKLRIAHSHSNREHIEPSSGPRALYLKLMKWLVRIFANKYVAVSREAQRSLYADVVDEQKVEILYCGIQHLSQVDFNTIKRSEFKIDDDVFVMGHVGRLSEPKNHTYILDIFRALLDKCPAVLVLVGDGELRADIEEKVVTLGLVEHVRMLGMRDDAVDIMATLFDAIAFPSLYEGLPLTVVESQAVGVPILVADNITKEAEFDSQFVRYASLSESPEVWADKLIALKNDCKSVSPSEKYKDTDFYLPNHLISLERLYRDTLFR